MIRPPANSWRSVIPAHDQARRDPRLRGGSILAVYFWLHERLGRGRFSEAREARISDARQRDRQAARPREQCIASRILATSPRATVTVARENTAPALHRLPDAPLPRLRAVNRRMGKRGDAREADLRFRVEDDFRMCGSNTNALLLGCYTSLDRNLLHLLPCRRYSGTRALCASRLSCCGPQNRDAANEPVASTTESVQRSSIQARRPPTRRANNSADRGKAARWSSRSSRYGASSFAESVRRASVSLQRQRFLRALIVLTCRRRPYFARRVFEEGDGPMASPRIRPSRFLVRLMTTSLELWPALRSCGNGFCAPPSHFCRAPGKTEARDCAAYVACSLRAPRNARQNNFKRSRFSLGSPSRIVIATRKQFPGIPAVLDGVAVSALRA